METSWPSFRVARAMAISTSLTIASGDLKRLTFDDGMDQIDNWSRDGKWIYFTNGTQDVGHKGDLYRVSVEGGTPIAGKCGPLHATNSRRACCPTVRR